MFTFTYIYEHVFPLDPQIIYKLVVRKIDVCISFFMDIFYFTSSGSIAILEIFL